MKPFKKFEFNGNIFKGLWISQKSSVDAFLWKFEQRQEGDQHRKKTELVSKI